MSNVYVFKVDGEIVGVFGSPQDPIAWPDLDEVDSEDPEIIEWAKEHNAKAPYA